MITNDALGERLTAFYSVIDDETGKIVFDNRRLDKVVNDRKSALGKALLQYAQNFVEQDEKNSNVEEEKEPIIDDGTEGDVK